MAELGERLEFRNDAVHKMRHLMEEWNNRLTLNNLRFTERYIKGDLDIHILIHRDGSLETAYYCAVLKYWNGAIGLDAERPIDFKRDISGDGCVPSNKNI